MLPQCEVRAAEAFISSGSTGFSFFHFTLLILILACTVTSACTAACFPDKLRQGIDLSLKKNVLFLVPFSSFFFFFLLGGWLFACLGLFELILTSVIVPE